MAYTFVVYKINKAMKKNILKTLILPILIAFPMLVFGQANYSLSTDQLKLIVKGTSTIHDWEMVSEMATGSAAFTFNGNQLTSVSRLFVDMPVSTLKSGTSGMDDNAYKALKATEFPKIRFVVKEATELTGEWMMITGDLTISGVTKPVKFKTQAIKTGNKVTINGSTAIKYTEFKIQPPTAVFGTIKCGDDLTLSFQACFATKESGI